MKFFSKKIFLFLVVFCLLLFFSGPGWFYIYSPTLSNIEVNSSTVDEYIKEKEARVADIKANNQAHLQRANQSKTPYAIVYLHGFSAGPKEISPVVERLSENLKMNAYFARLKSHGVKNDLMENLTADQLFQDAEEAYLIGKSIGEKVILVGTSTGATLAVWLASRHPDISGLVLISPNFGIFDPRGFLLAGPLGNLIGRAVGGPYYEWLPRHLHQDLFWTTRYSINGIRAMTDVVHEAVALPLSNLKTPSLILWTEQDKVVDIHKAIAILKKLGSDKKTFIEINSSEHVLAGDITSPNTTDEVVKDVSQFLINIPTNK